MKRSILFIIVTLMAFCAVAQDLYIGSFYVTTESEEKLYGDGNDKWATRKGTICEMFRYEMPDVLGLQSASSSQLSAIRTGMNSGLTNIASYKLAGDILYNSKAVELDTCSVVEDMPEGSTCSWAKFQKEGKTFYVLNMCLADSVALSSMNRIRTAADVINKENVAVFLVGYLGVNETKTAYTRMTGKFNDCYKKAPIVSAEYGTVNNFDLENNHGSNRYDFVTANKKVTTIKAYGQLQYGYFTKESDGSNKRRLPSTHFPVMAKVKLP